MTPDSTAFETALVEIEARQMAGLERLRLLEAGERDKPTIARAVERFLDGAAHVGALGDALWPASEDAA